MSFAGISALLPSALAGQVRGKPTAYFFGFTHCPEVCPTTLFEMTQRLKDLGQGADPLIGVGATWIVGEVEVEHDLAVMCRTQIRPLDGVEEVTAPGERLEQTKLREELQKRSDELRKRLEHQGRAIGPSAAAAP